MEALPHCPNHVDAADALRPCARCGTFLCGDCLVDIGGHLLCAECKNEQIRDVVSGVDGKTRIDLASTSLRLGAWLIDIAPVLVVQYYARRWLASNGIYMTTLINPLGIATSLLFVLYESIMLQWRGQTTGKILVRLKVVTAAGEDISVGQAWGRSLSRSILGYTFGLEYLPAFFTRERTTVHDLLAKTRVVRVD